MHTEQKVNVHNRFDIEVTNVSTGEVKQKAVAYNIILNQMYNRLCNGQSYFGNIHFGTGTGSIIATRTSLFTHLGTKSAITDEIIKALPVSKWKRKIVLNPEEYVGSIITEVGIAFDSNTGSLITHAELKDSEGNPISINKTATDVVTIYASVFITFSNTNPSLVLVGLPNDNKLINYLTGSNAPSGPFGLMPGKNFGESLGTTSTASWIVDIPNKQRKTNVTRFGIDTANGDAQSIYFYNLFSLNIPASGIFEGQPYTNVPIGVGDGVTTKFILPSKNIKQDTIAMKKNGVVTSAYTKMLTSMTNFKIQNPSVLPTSTAYGVAVSSDGTLMAVAHNISPFITTYDWDGAAWIKRPNPSSVPPDYANGVSLSSDGTLMAVAHVGSPYITTYDWDGVAWIKRPNPSVLPTSTAYGVSLSSDDTLMAVAHGDSPYITTYDWDGAAWIKRPNPSVLPTNTANGVSLSSDGTLMAVAHFGSPYITTYDWDGAAWIKRPNPSSVLPSTANGVSLSSDDTLMAVAHGDSPYITTYDSKPRTTKITFTTPPAIGEVITADYTVEGIHKTNQYVVDVSFAIQFGEGV